MLEVRSVKVAELLVSVEGVTGESFTVNVYDVAPSAVQVTVKEVVVTDTTKFFGLNGFGGVKSTLLPCVCEYKVETSLADKAESKAHTCRI